MSGRVVQAEFSAETSLPILRKACDRIDVDPAGARLLRLGENAIYALEDDSIVVRIARSLYVLDDVRKEVGVARWLHAANYPAVRLADLDITQPVVIDDHPVTFWERVETADERPTAADLGRLLRRLHDLAVPEWLGLPKFQPFGRVQRRLANPPSVADPYDVEYLRERFLALQAEYRGVSFVFPPGPVHGDAHPGNLLRTVSGEVLLIDFEAFCYGPREWDLTLSAAYRYAFEWFTDNDYENFTAAYGYDVASWPGYAILRSVRELGMTSWLMQMVDNDPVIAEEFRRRVDDMRSNRFPRRWRPF